MATEQQWACVYEQQWACAYEPVNGPTWIMCPGETIVPGTAGELSSWARQLGNLIGDVISNCPCAYALGAGQYNREEKFLDTTE